MEHLLSGQLLAVPVRVLPLLSSLLSGHQELDTPSLALFEEYDEVKYSLRWVTTDCGLVILLPSCDCFKMK